MADDDVTGLTVEDGVTGLTVELEAVAPHDPGTVWDLVTDVDRVHQWSPECVETGWVHGDGPHPGGRFTGRNAFLDMEWTVTGEVIEAERPRVFAWKVIDAGDPADRPSSLGRYELSPAPDGGTLIRQTFTHGVGNSRLRELIARNPEKAQQIIAYRQELLRKNMAETLAAMLDTVS
ncbi:MAG TPA: SRPBCC family protein [Micromonospora sp.]